MSNGTKTWTMTYGTDGLRTSRIATDSEGNVGSKYYYYYEGGLLTYMKYNSLVMRFTYDAQGKPVSMTYDGNTYYYALNLQGDVMALLDSSGNEVVSYHYNAWGKLLNTTASTTGMLYSLALYNPLRYRGYVYDRETGLYYLQSRYYNPEICRFVSADDVDLLGANDAVISYNLYAYCSNNPVTRADDGGQFWNVVIGAVVGGVISGVVTAVTSYIQTGSVDWGSVAINVAAGAIGGAVAATGLGAFTQAGITAVASGAGNLADQCYSKGVDNINWLDVGCSTGLGFLTSLAGTGAGKLLGGKMESAGISLLNKGRDKLLTGYIRETVGQSHSSLIKQGTKLVTKGTTMINTFRGTSSVVGSFIGGGAGAGYNYVKSTVLGW